MVRGLAGFGRYDDDQDYIACPHAKSDMTPCIARDGNTALAGEYGSGRTCVGCGSDPKALIGELAAAGYTPAQHPLALPRGVDSLPDEAAAWALILTGLVRTATEPLVS
jgi:hypothetical protein